MNGPHKGFIYELEPGWPAPNALALRTTQQHWYRVEGDKGYYDRSGKLEWEDLS